MAFMLMRGGTIYTPPVQAFASLYPRLGSYAIGGTQNYHNAAVMDALAKRHVNIVAHYPGWQNNKGTTQAAIMQSVKAASTIGTKFFQYIIYSEIAKANANTGQALWEPYQYINSNKLFAYSNGSAETGPLDADAGPSIAKINYSLGAKTVAGKKLYQYMIDWHTGVNRDGVAASNGTSSFTAAVNPHVNGMFFDNVFWKERTNADYDRNGSTDGTSTYARAQAVQSWHEAAIDYYNTVWPGAELMVNSADWGQQDAGTGFPDFSTDSVLVGRANGGAIESIDAYEALSAVQVMSAIQTQMASYAAPKMGILGWPLASFTDFQQMRYGLGVALVTDTFYYPYVTTYLSQDLPSLWFPEFDFNLGTRISAPTYTPTHNVEGGGTGGGCHVATFSNGKVVLGMRRGTNAGGDQTTPYASIALGGTYRNITTDTTATTCAVTPRDCAIFEGPL